MNTLVVYDTQYGNTEHVARAIGFHLEARGTARVVSVRESAAIDLTGVDLLVVGGPTQAHGATRPLRDWIDEAPTEALRGLATATFDTRLRWPLFLSGSAARSIAKTLESRGARLVAPPESFFVAGSEGPLAQGELDHATAWAETLGSKLEADTAPVEPVQRAS